ncbi:alkaline phytoceramidase [Pestalotiopsis sp. NC0098]|nr:alkaline phytoceramidase [Pestalotiopsis sp. NC0098]
MGHHNRHFAGDANTHTGIWGSPTSAANFCEEDYAITRFVAEFVNTLSNLAYVYFAFKYPGRCAHGRPALDSLSWSMLLLGVTSTAFHATLRQGAQLSDDLSMLLLVGVIMQHVYCLGQPRVRSRLVAATIWASISGVSFIYVRSGDLLIHVSAFAVSVTLVGLRLVQLIYRGQQQQESSAELATRFWKGCAYLAVAFALWNVDLELCLQLREWRQHVGLPLSWLMELHAWWHILTAAGAAQFIRLVRCLCDDDQAEGKSQGGNIARGKNPSPSAALHRGMPQASKADLDRIGSSR